MKMAMNKLLGGLLLGGMLGLVQGAFAQDIAPDVLAKKVTDEVLTILRSDKDIQSGNTRKVYDLVEAKVLPHFNFSRMTRLAVGAPWRQANPAQDKLTFFSEDDVIWENVSAILDSAKFRKQADPKFPLKNEKTGETTPDEQFLFPKIVMGSVIL